MTTQREQRKIDRAMKRFADERKRLKEFTVPSFASQSDGSGVEQNGRLKKLDELNRHAPRQGERRRAGFPPTFGQFMRDAKEQADAAIEARVRLLSPTIDRLAASRKANITREQPEPDRLPRWFALLILGCGITLLWAAIEWYLMVRN